MPVTTLGTTRTEVELLDRDGRAVAVLCDDLVRVEPGRRRWRELEVELIGDGPGPAVRDGADLLAKVTRCFAAQGVHPASSPSKLSRALGDRPTRAERGLGPGRQDPAADVVLTYLAEQVAAIRGWQDGLRSDAEGAVHKARVACRRSRSALRTFRRLLDRQVSDPLRQEIRWFAGVLGGPRDAEVQQARLLQQLAALPEDEVVGPVQERIRAELDRRHTQQLAALHRALDGPRYAALVDALTELVAYPPWRARASRTAQEVLPPLVDSAVDRARADWDRARATEGEERLRLLHETRKSAKAVRYAWEALAPAFGEPAAQQARDWERVTEQLGAAQDAVVATARLRELLAAARLAEEPTATYVLLLRRELGEQERAAAAGAQLVAHLLDH